MSQIFAPSTIITGLLVLVMNALVLAQPVNKYVNDVVQSAPNATAIARYGEVPVSYYTGVPDISIPIYHIKDGGLNLPISLSYHASGLRAAERASWVGLGWSLNTGGAITRTVLGLADDNTGGYYWTGASLTASTQDKLDVAQGVRDGEPDIFNFSAGGYSGKFYFDKNKNLVQIPQSDIKINHFLIGLTFVGFEVITPDGTKYLFGDNPNDNIPGGGTETTINDGVGYNSTWYLMRITSFDGANSIAFEYDAETYYISNTGTGTATRVWGVNPNNSVCMETIIQPPQSVVSDITGVRLKKITNRTTTIEFIASVADREDIAQCKRLDKIKISEGTSGAFCQQFELQHTYWDDGGGVPNIGKRLRLNAINQKSCDLVTIGQSWSFNYYGYPDYDNNYLPNLNTKAVDHWGFFNGQTSNNANLINVPPTTVINPPPSLTYGASNRESNGSFCVAGTLEKINHPTGGYTRFEYEANTYPRWQVVDSTTTGLLNLQSPGCAAPFYPCCSGLSSLQSATLSNPISEYYFDLSLNSSTSCPVAIVQVNVYSNTNAYLGSYGFGWTSSWNNSLAGLPLSTFPVTFVQGQTYKFEIEGIDGIGTFNLYRKTYISNWYNRPVGGLRIKKIVNNPTQSVANEEVYAMYEYKDITAPTKSSGELYDDPIYGWALITLAGGSPIHKAAVIQDASLNSLGNFNGYHIGYRFVTEIKPANGKKVFEYNLGSAPPPASLPFAPVMYNSQAGNMKKAQVYNEANTSLQETNYLSDVNGTPYVSEQGLIYKLYTVASGVCNGIPKPSYITTYSPRTSLFRLASVTETMDGTSPVTTTYTYPTTGSKSLVKTQSQTIDGKTYLTTNVYPFELIGAVYDRLKDQNRIAAPLETTLAVNSVVVSGAKTEFSFYDAATGLPTASTAATNPLYPWKFSNYLRSWNNSGTPTGGVWDLKGTVDKYSITFGRPTQFTSTNWPSETYEWETNGLIKKRIYQNHSWEYFYHTGTRLLSSIKDLDGQVAWFDYDPLLRLQKSWSKPGSSTVKTTANVTSEYSYVFGAQSYIKNKLNYTPVSGSALAIKEVFQYVDGLGRPKETVSKQQSPDAKDVVSDFTIYDHFGRATKIYNPWETANTSGTFVASPPGGTPFTQIDYEASPLNREWKTTPPSWYATATTYGTNIANEVLQDHTANTFYGAGQLYKTSVTDPENNVTITYKDRRGRHVLTRKTNTSNITPVNTYNFYDDKDRLVKVMPPGSTFASTTLNFVYTYDDDDNMLTKKVPDAAVVNMKYNIRDQLALEQDGKLLAQNKWRCMQYDEYGRPIKTGLYTGTVTDPVPLTTTPTELNTENIYGTAGIEKGKVKTSKSRILDNTNTWLQTTFVYDAFGRASSTSGNNHLLPADLNAEALTYQYDYADNILTDTRTSKKTASASYSITQKHSYDHWGRNTLNTHKVGSGSEMTINELKYNWKNELKERNIGKAPSASNYLQSLDYTYNDMGWMLTMNASGLGGTNVGMPSCPTNPTMPNPGAANVTPDLNDLFYLELKYDQLQSGLAGTAQKNGNISQVIWRTRGRERQAYSLGYDYLSRMTSATYSGINDAGTANSANAWNESLTYDLRGNIQNLARTGKYKTTPTASCWTDGQIDNLSFAYWTNTNRVRTITDNAPAASKANGWNKTISWSGTSTTYNYDQNGNLTYDPDKGMDVTYNYLNLPDRMSWNNTNTFQTREIKILYDGAGRKLRKSVIDYGNALVYHQDYVNGIEYRSTSTVSLSLESMYHGEGRVFNTSVGTTGADALRYEYSIRDHLGNTRLTFTDKNANGVVDVTNNTTNVPQNGVPPNEILQENHYYPFGLNMAGPWMNDAALDNRYQYNGKELNDDFGLGWNDYGARWYDAAVGRWWSVDLLSATTPRWSSYNYCFDNPLKFVDPMGMTPVYDWAAHNNGNKGIYTDSNTKEEMNWSQVSSTISKLISSTINLVSADKKIDKMMGGIMTNLATYLADAKMNVRVVPHMSTEEFSGEGIGAHDGVSVIGSTKRSTVKYINRTIASGITSADFKTYMNKTYFDEPTSINPEHADGGESGWGYVTGVTINNMNEKDAKGVQYGTLLDKTGIHSLTEAGAFFTLHGMGHMNGISHGGGKYPSMDRGFMTGANPLKDLIHRYKGNLSALIQNTVSTEPNMMLIIYQRWPKK